MSENYDFPLRIGETWNTSYVSSTTWSGSSDYITPFPSQQVEQTIPIGKLPMSVSLSTVWENRLVMEVVMLLTN